MPPPALPLLLLLFTFATVVVAIVVSVCGAVVNVNWSKPYLRSSSKSSSGAGIGGGLLVGKGGGFIVGACNFAEINARVCGCARMRGDLRCCGVWYGYNGLFTVLVEVLPRVLVLALVLAGNVVDFMPFVLTFFTVILPLRSGSGRAFWFSGSKSSKSKLVLLLSSSDIRSFMVSSWEEVNEGAADLSEYSGTGTCCGWSERSDCGAIEQMLIIFELYTWSV